MSFVHFQKRAAVDEMFTRHSVMKYPAIQVTRDRALRDWMLDETAEDLHRNFGSGYPGGNFSFTSSHFGDYEACCLFIDMFKTWFYRSPYKSLAGRSQALSFRIPIIGPLQLGNMHIIFQRLSRSFMVSPWYKTENASINSYFLMFSWISKLSYSCHHLLIILLWLIASHLMIIKVQNMTCMKNWLSGVWIYLLMCVIDAVASLSLFKKLMDHLLYIMIGNQMLLMRMAMKGVANGKRN